jgi:cell division protein FtsI/penicillin-binding protein 2
MGLLVVLMQPINGKIIAAMMSPRTFDGNFMMGSSNKI